MEQLGGAVVVNDTVYPGQGPMQFQETDDQGFGVRIASKKLLMGKRLSVVESSQDVGDYTQYRKTRLRGWRAAWSTDSLMGVSLYTHLTRLYDNRETFWLQMDGYMSRNYGILVPVSDSLQPGDYKPFFTPTFPVFPSNWTMGNPITWDQNDLLVGSRYWPGGFTVDQETGLVLLAPYPRDVNNVHVYFRYVWRVPVYLDKFELEPTDVAQTVYAGSAEFVQVEMGYPAAIKDVSVSGGIAIVGRAAHA